MFVESLFFKRYVAHRHFSRCWKDAVVSLKFMYSNFRSITVQLPRTVAEQERLNKFGNSKCGTGNMSRHQSLFVCPVSCNGNKSTGRVPRKMTDGCDISVAHLKNLARFSDKMSSIILEKRRLIVLLNMALGNLSNKLWYIDRRS